MVASMAEKPKTTYRLSASARPSSLSRSPFFYVIDPRSVFVERERGGPAVILSQSMSNAGRGTHMVWEKMCWGIGIRSYRFASSASFSSSPLSALPPLTPSVPRLTPFLRPFAPDDTDCHRERVPQPRRAASSVMEVRDDLLPLFSSSRSLIPEMDGGIGARARVADGVLIVVLVLLWRQKIGISQEQRFLRLGGWRVSE